MTKRPEGDTTVEHILDLLHYNAVQAENHGEDLMASDLRNALAYVADVALTHDLITAGDFDFLMS